MNLYLLTRILLALHITGIIMMAGTTMIDYITYRVFWNSVDSGDMGALSLVQLMSRYGALIRSGAIVIIITGVSMIAINKGVVEGQLWFKVKTALLVALVSNGLFIGNTNGTRLRNAVITHGADFMHHTAGLRETMGRFYPIQLGLFFVIILISITRLNG